MEETITIRCYNAVTGEYYDKQIPYVYDLDKGKADKITELENFITSNRANGIE